MKNKDLKIQRLKVIERILGHYYVDQGSTQQEYKAKNMAELIEKEITALESEPGKAEETILIDDGSVMGRTMKRSDYDAQFTKKKEAEERKTAETVLANQIFRTKCDFTDEEYWNIYRAMEILASQSLPEITDDEIVAYVKKTYVECDFYEKSLVVDGAKWYKNELKKRV